jgi:hypothetical protein
MSNHHPNADWKLCYRVNVDVEPNPEHLSDVLEQLALRKPVGRVTILKPFGFAFRGEPEILIFVGTGFSLGMVMLLMEVALRAPMVSHVAQILTVFFFFLTVFLLLRFLIGLNTQFEVWSEGDSLLFGYRRLGFALRSKKVEANAIVGVCVWRADGMGTKIVLAGPRHQTLAEVFRLGALEPETVANWLTDMIAVVAKRASAR